MRFCNEEMVSAVSVDVGGFSRPGIERVRQGISLSEQDYRPTKRGPETR